MPRKKWRPQVSDDVLNSFGYGGFDNISDMFTGIDSSPDRIRQRSTRKRKRDFAIERAGRVQSGEAPLSAEEARFNEVGLDIFGQPINYKSKNYGY